MGEKHVQRAICNGKTNPVKDLVDFVAPEERRPDAPSLSDRGFRFHSHGWDARSCWSSVLHPECSFTLQLTKHFLQPLVSIGSLYSYFPN